MTKIFLKNNDEDQILWKKHNVLNNSDYLDDEIRSRYKTPGDSIAFARPQLIYDEYNGQIPLKRINEILKTIDSYTLHKEFHKSQYNISYARYKRYQFQLDLCFLLEYQNKNDGVKYLLTVIDCFTRYAFVRPLINKESSNVLNSFKSILEEAQSKPYMIVCDKGSEFINKNFIKYCKDVKIKLVNPKSNNHAAYIERFNRTIQLKINKYITEMQNERYIDHLQDLVKSYNNEKHRMIKMSPYEAENNPNAEMYINKLIAKKEMMQRIVKPSLKVGEFVRISKEKTKFSRGYNKQAQIEIFKIKRISDNKRIPLYYLEDLGEEEIQGGFYRSEITPVNIENFKIEKVLRRKKVNGKNMVLVKWLGYGDKFNQWIEASDVEDLE